MSPLGEVERTFEFFSATGESKMPVVGGADDYQEAVQISFNNFEIFEKFFNIFLKCFRTYLC